MKSLKDRIEELSLPQETKDKIFDAVLQAGRVSQKRTNMRLVGILSSAAVLVFIALAAVAVSVISNRSDDMIAEPNENVSSADQRSAADIDKKESSSTEENHEHENDINTSDTLVQSDSSSNTDESSMISDSTDDIRYNIVSADWPMYSSVGNLDAASNLIVMGKVTGISFDFVDLSTGKLATSSSKEADRCFSTIYDVDIMNCYKGNASGEKLQVLISSGIKDAYIEEQLQVLGDEAEGIPIVACNIPKIDIGKTYLFVLKQYEDCIPTVVNMEQGVYAADTPLEKDIMSISLKDVLAYYGKETDAI